MEVTLQIVADKHGINDKPLKAVEIVNERITVLMPNGKKKDFSVKQIVSFGGEITFGANGQITAVEDESEAAPMVAQPAPLFESNPDRDGGSLTATERPAAEPPINGGAGIEYSGALPADSDDAPEAADVEDDGEVSRAAYRRPKGK